MLCTLATAADRDAIEAFLASAAAPLWQFPVWADFQEARGVRVLRLVLRDDAGTIFGYAQCFLQRRRFGLSWLHVPRGPVCRDAELLVFDFQLFLDAVEKLAREHGCLFVRFDWGENMKDGTRNTEQKKLILAGETQFPETTLVLDLHKTEDELLAQMKPKGRYNIRVAEKHGITVSEERDQAAADIFFSLLQKTTARDGFRGHGQDYYRQFLHAFGDAVSCFVARARDGTPLAAAIVTFVGDTAVYYYGASDHAFRHLMAPYAVQWAAIRAAKARGFARYDFLGIAPLARNTEHGTGTVIFDEEHPLFGVTQFKTKFGGELISYPASQELVIRPLLHRLFSFLRRLRAH